MKIEIFWGNILRSVRVRRGYSQEEVSTYLGCSRQAYSNFETGRTHPSPEVIALLSELYEIDFIDFVLRSMPVECVQENAEYKAQLKEQDEGQKKRRISAKIDPTTHIEIS